MKGKRIWLDPALWALLGINVFLIIKYYQHPEIFSTLIWLYWAQSVLLGLFTMLDILTVRTIKAEMVNVNGKMQSSQFTSRIGSAMFFAVHYGMFHLVYFIFLASMTNRKAIDWEFFKYFFYAFMVGQAFSFIQHKIQQRKVAASLSTLFITPYARIIPMHLTILLPHFIGISSMGIFLALKAVADVVMYVVTKPGYKSREADAAMLATQQGMNM